MRYQSNKTAILGKFLFLTSIFCMSTSSSGAAQADNDIQCSKSSYRFLSAHPGSLANVTEGVRNGSITILSTLKLEIANGTTSCQEACCQSVDCNMAVFMSETPVGNSSQIPQHGNCTLYKCVAAQRCQLLPTSNDTVTYFLEKPASTTSRPTTPSVLLSRRIELTTDNISIHRQETVNMANKSPNQVAMETKIKTQQRVFLTDEERMQKDKTTMAALLLSLILGIGFMVTLTILFLRHCGSANSHRVRYTRIDHLMNSP